MFDLEPTAFFLVLGGVVVVLITVLLIATAPRPFAKASIAPGTPFLVEGACRSGRLRLWLAHDLLNHSGERPRSAGRRTIWPEGLGLWLDVTVQLDGAVIRQERIEVRGTAPAGLTSNVTDNATTLPSRHRATKLLRRIDAKRGGHVRVDGVVHLMHFTEAQKLELLLD